MIVFCAGCWVCPLFRSLSVFAQLLNEVGHTLLDLDLLALVHNELLQVPLLDIGQLGHVKPTSLDGVHIVMKCGKGANLIGL